MQWQQKRLRQLTLLNALQTTENFIRRDAGAVELDSLENCCGVSHRGFESHSLRFFNLVYAISVVFLVWHLGAVAQLGECVPRTDEVTGSNPVCSIYEKIRTDAEQTSGT